ncbi:MAG: hypothetical protein RL325_1221 [Planctomycetota bacterium]
MLMYHHVGDWGPSNAGWSDWVVRPAEFAKQLDWLKENGYRTITFRELLAAADRGVAADPRSVIISFDDGWAEAYHWIRAELEPRGMKAVLFVFTGAVAANRNGGGYISWEELHELEASGHEVQSHTVSHPALAGLPPAMLARELAESRRVIEQQTLHPAEALAYPFGSFDRAALEAAHAAGYRIALRAEADPAVAATAPLAYPRIRVGYDDPIEVFADRIRSGFTPRSLR